MSATNQAADVIVYALGVGGILVLTRPGSQGPGLLKNFGDLAVGLVQASSGQKVTGI
jgi:hypothetical protein